MKVKDIIKELQLLDKEAIVVISGYEGGCNEISNVNLTQIALNVNDAKTWYYGRHEVVENDYHKAQYPETHYKLEQAVYLS